MEPGWSIVGEASSLEGLREQVASLSPDLLLLDYHMPGGDTAATADWLLRRHEGLKLVMLTGAQSPTVYKQMLELGVHGLLLKQGSGAELVQALHRVLRGERVVGGELAAAAAASDSGLTPRELQVAKLVIDGLTNAQIGQHLSLSPKTVDKHRENLMRKLAISSAAQLVSKAHEMKLFA